MIQKILAVAVAALVVVVCVLGFQLRGANADIATLTIARDAAQTDAANARRAQQTAEGQNKLLIAGFAALDGRLRTLDSTQRSNTEKLAAQLAGLNNIQKTEGDTDASFECLDQPLPRELDQRLRQ